MKKIFKTRDEMLEVIEKKLVVAELGVFEGDFAKKIKQICNPSKLFLVDLFDGYFGSGDKDGKNYHYVHLDQEMNKLIEYFDGDSSVEIIKKSTYEFLNNLENEYLDMVYIDADHSYSSVLQDLELSYLKVKKGGYICGHDYVYNTEAQKAVDYFCEKFNLQINYITEDGCPSFCIFKN